MFGTALSMHLQRQSCGLVERADKTTPTQLHRCPVCFTLMVPSVTCSVRISEQLKPLRTKNKNKRARDRQLKFKNALESSKSSYYVHYTCLADSAVISHHCMRQNSKQSGGRETNSTTARKQKRDKQKYPTKTAKSSAYTRSLSMNDFMAN